MEVLGATSQHCERHINASLLKCKLPVTHAISEANLETEYVWWLDILQQCQAAYCTHQHTGMVLSVCCPLRVRHQRRQTIRDAIDWKHTSNHTRRHQMCVSTCCIICNFARGVCNGRVEAKTLTKISLFLSESIVTAYRDQSARDPQ